MEWQHLEHGTFGEHHDLPDALTAHRVTPTWEYLEVVAAYASEQARWLAHMVNGEEMSNWRQAGLDIATYIGEATGLGWRLISVKVPAHRVPGGTSERRIYVFKRTAR
jgi:hypothetical protein